MVDAISSITSGALVHLLCAREDSFGAGPPGVYFATTLFMVD